jgi:hypothetical protein
MLCDEPASSRSAEPDRKRGRVSRYARALGLEVPLQLQQLADEVIE